MSSKCKQQNDLRTAEKKTITVRMIYQEMRSYLVKGYWDRISRIRLYVFSLLIISYEYFDSYAKWNNYISVCIFLVNRRYTWNTFTVFQNFIDAKSQTNYTIDLTSYWTSRQMFWNTDTAPTLCGTTASDEITDEI